MSSKIWLKLTSILKTWMLCWLWEVGTTQQKTPQVQRGRGGASSKGRGKGRGGFREFSKPSKTSAPTEAVTSRKVGGKTIPKWAFEEGQALNVPQDTVIQRWNDRKCVLCGQDHRASGCPRRVDLPKAPEVAGAGSKKRKP